MKKMLSVLLSILTLVAVLCSCGKQSDNKGAIINMYLGSELRNYDPALAYTDESAVKFFELIYEGLFDISDSGKVTKALCKNYKTWEDDGETVMEIELIDSRWNDGRTVKADDIIYAWKRILDPEFSSPAAALLYDIKNARAVKEGTMSIDDLGLYSEDTKIMQIILEKDTDVDLFIETLASPALVPVREDQVTKGSQWSLSSSSIMTNGPFYIKSFDSDYANKTLVLERSTFYHTNEKKSVAYDKYVTPYRIVVDYSKNAEERAEAYSNKELFFMSNIPAGESKNFKKVSSSELLSSYTYIFDTTNPLFEKSEVRRAMSLALDRNEIANRVGDNTLAATGLVPNGVFNTGAKTSFRKQGGNLISADANMDEAKNLLKQAGVSGGKFTLTYQNSDKNKTIAEYAKEVWEELGFQVTLNAVASNGFRTAYTDGKFDVIGLDYQALSTNAWSMLAPFAYQFAGNAFDLSTAEVEYVPHISGYDSEDYNSLISSAFDAKKRADKAEYLHQAESLLMEDMPCIPVIFNVDTYATQELSGIKENAFGIKIFTSTKQKNFKKYLPEQ